MKKYWAYIFGCPICSKRVKVRADLGVTPEKPDPTFYSPCPECHARIEFKAKYLTLSES